MGGALGEDRRPPGAQGGAGLTQSEGHRPEACPATLTCSGELFCSLSLLGEQSAPGPLSHSIRHICMETSLRALRRSHSLLNGSQEGCGAAWGVWGATESPPRTVRSGRRPRPAATLPLTPGAPVEWPPRLSCEGLDAELRFWVPARFHVPAVCSLLGNPRAQALPSREGQRWARRRQKTREAGGHLPRPLPARHCQPDRSSGRDCKAS